ncbi:MAG: hypothetical protein MJ101_03790 [Clostridia bacterium]|nr:hypothetical protein [Clostridia bacterium]
MGINSKMTAIANAIRAKTSGTEPLSLDDMATAIASIQTGGSSTDTVKFDISPVMISDVTTVTGPSMTVPSECLAISSPVGIAV